MHIATRDECHVALARMDGFELLVEEPDLSFLDDKGQTSFLFGS